MKQRRQRYLMAAVAALTVVVAALFWLFDSEAGLAWTASLIEGASGGAVRLEDTRGQLSGPLSIGRLTLAVGAGRHVAEGLHLDWRPRSLLAGWIDIDTLTVERIVLTPAPEAAPPTAPDDLHLPFELRIAALEIGSLEWRQAPEALPRTLAHDLRAGLESNDDGYRLAPFSARLEGGSITASAGLGASAPFPIDGRIEFAGMGQPSVNAWANFKGTLADVALACGARGAELSFDASARLALFSAQPVVALKANATEFDPRAFHPAAPTARIALDADLADDGHGALAGRLRFDNAAPAAADEGGLPLARVDTRLVLSSTAGRALRLHDLTIALATRTNRDAGLLRGSFDLVWHPGEPLPQGTADLSVTRFDPAALNSALRSGHLNGRMRLSGNAESQHADLDLADRAFRLEAKIDRRGDALKLSRLRLVRENSELLADGSLRLDGERSWQVSGTLHRFDLAAFAALPKSDINATFSADGTLLPNPAGQMHFDLRNSRLAGKALGGHGQVAFVGIEQPDELLRARGKARIWGELSLTHGNNRLSADGGLGGKHDRLRFTLQAPTLAWLGPGYGGALDVSAVFAGGLDAPELDLQGRARNLVLPDGHQLADMETVARLRGQSLNLDIRARDFRRQGHPVFDKLGVAIDGTQARHRLNANIAAGSRRLDVEAVGALALSTTDWRNSSWRGSIDALALAGDLPVVLLQPATLTANRSGIVVGATEATFADGRVSIAAAQWTPQRWTSRGHFTGVALRPAGFGLAGREPVLRLAGDWDLNVSDTLKASLHVRRESGDWTLPGYVARPLGLESLNLSATGDGGRMQLALDAAGARIGRWHADAALALRAGPNGWSVAEEAPLAGKVQAVVPDLAWVGPAIDNNLTSSGQIEIDADLAGSWNAPRAHGRIVSENLALGLIDQNFNLREGKLDLRFDRETITLERFEFLAAQDPPARAARIAGFPARSAPGRLAVAGSIDPWKPAAHLTATFDRLPLFQRPERWLVASGTTKLDFADARMRLDAVLKADAGFIAEAASSRPQLADDVVVLGRKPPVRRTPRIESDIALDLGDHFHLHAAGLAARLSGRLRLRGSGERPLIATGSIAATDAVYTAYGQRLSVERGIVSFQGPLDDPGLDVLALRKDLPVEAGVAVTGTAQKPEVRLVSTPPVPDAEKLSWLVLGRAPERGGSDATMLLAAASSILGGKGEGVTTRIAEALGVDEFSLRRAGSSEVLADQILTIGKRLSAKAYVGYEQGMAASIGTLRFTYILSRRVSIVTRTGENNAVDLFYSFSFD